MSFNKKFFTTGGIVASTPSAPAAGLDPLQNFETVTYTGNGSTQKITGYIRKGGAFNGSSSKIDISSISIPLNDFSYSLWFKANDTSSFQVLISHENGGRSYGIQLNNNANIGSYMLNSSGGTEYLLSNSITINTDWHNVVITKSSSQGHKIYYDGVNIASDSTFTGNLLSGNFENYLGSSASGTSGYFNGSIDQVRIFNRVLLEDNNGVDEIQALADETYADPKKSTTDYFGDGSGVALYELDEDADDTGSFPYGTGDIDAGQSAVFNGSSSYITTPSFFSNPNTNSSTFSAWFNTSINDSNLRAIAANRNGGAGYIAYDIYTQNGVLVLSHQYLGGGGASSITGTTNIADGDWHNVIVVLDNSNGTLKMYLDGSQEGTTYSFTSGQNLTQFANTLYIGKTFFNERYFNGSIDQVRIYSSALSASDVEALVSETNVPTANLVAHYKLDGNANDETTNYDGTWGGTEAYSDPAEFPLIQYNGTPTNVNFLGMAFQPDLVWIKRRDSGIGDTNHLIFDSERGAGERLSSDNANQEYTLTDEVTSFDSNGFTVGADASTNGSGGSIVAWCWKAADTTTYLSASGSQVAADIKANTAAGFSIVKYTFSSPSSSQTVPHGLSSAPEMIITKCTSDTDNWYTYHKDVGTGKYLMLNSNVQATTYANGFSTVDATAWQEYFRSDAQSYVAYCFHSVDGYQKVGSYEGTNAPNNVVTTGFRPRWIMIKSTGATNGDWNIFDTVRENEPLGDALKANTSSSEVTEAAFVVDITDTGFELDGASGAGGTGQINSSGITYIYLAIA